MKIFEKRFRVGAAVILALATLFIACAAAAKSAALAADAELPVLTLIEGDDISTTVNAERGAAFDFDDLPKTLKVMGYVPDWKFPVKTDCEVRWQATDEAAAKAARSEDFTVTGIIERGVWQDTAYSVTGDNAVTANVRFVDRSPAAGMTFRIKPAYKYGTDKLVTTSMITFFDAPFDWEGVTGVELQYSFGDGWVGLPVDEEKWLGSDDATVQVEFVNEEFYDDEPYVFAEKELKRFITDLVHFRFKITGGLFEGYTNTVTIEGETSKINGDGTNGGESGILPDHYNGGSRGGAVAFWTSPGGTALAIVLGVIVAAGCFGIGLTVGLTLYRRRQKHCRGQKQARDEKET